MQRLFLALWPDDEVRAQLQAVRRRLPLRDGRLIPPPYLHATLVFLGAADAARRSCVERAAASVRAPAFVLELNTATWRRRGGLVWLTAAVPDALQRLVTDLNAALADCGHATEPRPYRLHVTLARNASWTGRDVAIAPMQWRAGEFCLVASRRTAHGSAYAVEARWRLG